MNKISYEVNCTRHARILSRLIRESSEYSLFKKTKTNKKKILKKKSFTGVEDKNSYTRRLPIYKRHTLSLLLSLTLFFYRNSKTYYKKNSNTD